MNPLFSNKVYDKLKFVALILLPALAAAYFSLAGVWGLPNADKVVGTATVVDTLLGVLLGLSSTKYTNSGGDTDGTLVVQHADGEQYMGLVVNKPAFDQLPNKDTVTLRVVNKNVPDAPNPQ